MRVLWCGGAHRGDRELDVQKPALDLGLGARAVEHVERAADVVRRAVARVEGAEGRHEDKRRRFLEEERRCEEMRGDERRLREGERG